MAHVGKYTIMDAMDDELLFTSICIIINTICVNGCGIVLGFFFPFSFCFFWLEVVLGLSRLRSGETSGEMQVACGLDTKTCCKKQMFPSISFLCVYLCMVTCACVFVYVVSEPVYFFYCCFVYSFNVLLFLYL